MQTGITISNISLRSVLDFQEIFFHDNLCSPYEEVDWHPFFTLATLGEVGTLINSYCKQVRSPNSYSAEIENDCADIFIFFITGLMLLERNEKRQVYRLVEEEWDKSAHPIANDKELISALNGIQKLLISVIEAESTQIYTEQLFLEFTKLIKSISFYLTESSWQSVINKFHIFTAEEFTTPNAYTPDLWYKGSCFVNFELLLKWINDNQVFIPKKRLLYIEHLLEINDRRSSS